MPYSKVATQPHLEPEQIHRLSFGQSYSFLLETEKEQFVFIVSFPLVASLVPPRHSFLLVYSSYSSRVLPFRLFLLALTYTFHFIHNHLSPFFTDGRTDRRTNKASYRIPKILILKLQEGCLSDIVQLSYRERCEDASKKML